MKTFQLIFNDDIPPHTEHECINNCDIYRNNGAVVAIIVWDKSSPAPVACYKI